MPCSGLTFQYLDIQPALLLLLRCLHLQMPLNHPPIHPSSRRLLLNPLNLSSIIPFPQLNHLIPQHIPLKHLQLLSLKRPALEFQTLLRRLRQPLIIRCIDCR
jgi:hypothetical protein